jgi:hypothetical protein
MRRGLRARDPHPHRISRFGVLGIRNLLLSMPHNRTKCFHIDAQNKSNTHNTKSQYDSRPPHDHRIENTSGRHLRRRVVALQPPQYHQRPSVPHNSQSGFTAKLQTREKIGSMSPAPRSMVTFSYEPQIVGQLPRPHNTQLGFTPRVQTLETIASNLPAVKSLVTCSSKSPIVEPLLFWPCTLSVPSSSSRRMVDHLVFPPSYCPYLLFHCPDRTSPRFLHLNPAWSTQTIRMLVAARRTHPLPPCLLKSLGPPSLTAFFSSSIFLEFSHLLPLRERPR